MHLYDDATANFVACGVVYEVVCVSSVCEILLTWHRVCLSGVWSMFNHAGGRRAPLTNGRQICILNKFGMEKVQALHRSRHASLHPYDETSSVYEIVLAGHRVFLSIVWSMLNHGGGGGAPLRNDRQNSVLKNLLW